MADFKKRLGKMLLLGFKQMKDPYYQGFAAQVAFYLLLSITPIFLLMTQILGVFGISVESALRLIEAYTGKQMSSMLNALFRFKSAGASSIVFAFIALWAGSRASFSIMRITNYTLTDGRSTGRNYFIERFRAVRTILVTIFTIVFSIVILAYGKLILEVIVSALGLPAGEYLDNVWMFLRWVLGFALYFMMVTYNYYLLTTERVKFKRILPGSLFASIGMLIVTLCYSKYANSLADYDILYGALSSVVAIMFWFFLLAWVLFLGVLFIKVWDESAEKPVSKRHRP